MLDIKLLYNTAYYLQTNKLSKQTNQIVKIALRFCIYTIEDLSL